MATVFFCIGVIPKVNVYKCIIILVLFPAKLKYIGASDIQNEGRWFYVDGTSVNLTIFDAYYLNNRDASFPSNDTRRMSADCGVLLNNSILSDENCESLHTFICELLF